MKLQVDKWLRSVTFLPVTPSNGSAFKLSSTSHRWKKITRVAYRIGVVYGGLYCVTTPQIYLALRGGGLGRHQEAADAWAKFWEIRPVRNWVSVHVLGRKLGGRFNGGDDPHTWAGQLCLAAVTAAATPILTMLPDCKAQVTLDPWSRAVFRFCLAGQMFSYGAAKAVPVQFPALTPSKLIEPLGNLSRMSLLWAQTGSSTVYQILLGAAEIIGGLLLIVPRTASLGALVSAAEMAQVFVLNATFDVPVKVHSFNLFLLNLLLLAPQASRLTGVLLTEHPVAAAAPQRLFRSRRANQIATVVQIGAGLWLLGTQVRNAWSLWKKLGGGQKKPELYGVWEVTDFSLDGERLEPITTDDRRWRRIAVDSVASVSIQRMDDSIEPCMAEIDMEARTLVLTRMIAPEQPVVLTIEHSVDDRVTLEGDLEGCCVRIELRRRDLGTFPLLVRGVRWVQEQSSLR